MSAISDVSQVAEAKAQLHHVVPHVSYQPVMRGYGHQFAYPIASSVAGLRHADTRTSYTPVMNGSQAWPGWGSQQPALHHTSTHYSSAPIVGGIAAWPMQREQNLQNIIYMGQTGVEPRMTTTPVVGINSGSGAWPGWTHAPNIPFLHHVSPNVSGATTTVGSSSTPVASVPESSAQHWPAPPANYKLHHVSAPHVSHQPVLAGMAAWPQPIPVSYLHHAHTQVSTAPVVVATSAAAADASEKKE